MGRLFKNFYDSGEDGIYIRHVSDRRYHILRWDNMDAACGADNHGYPTYAAALVEVDIDVLTAKQIADSLISCSGGEYVNEDDEPLHVPGYDSSEMPPDDESDTMVAYKRQRAREESNVSAAATAFLNGETVRVLSYSGTYTLKGHDVAEACTQYGLGAPLWNSSNNNLKKLLSEGKKTSRELEDDEDAYEAAMNRPVNMLGSTAREFGQGDIESAMMRGIAGRDPNAQIMGKIHGIPDEVMEEICHHATSGSFNGMSFRVSLHSADMPSDDPLAYSVGFIDAVSGKGKASTKGGELAPAYLEGYREGVSVKTGEKEWPAWIRPINNEPAGQVKTAAPEVEGKDASEDKEDQET